MGGVVSAAVLVRALRDPGAVSALGAPDWTALMAAARAERLLGTLACRLDGLATPNDVARILADVRVDAAREQRQALWEVDRALVALAQVSQPIVLLKGSAFMAAGNRAGQGRSIGDLDILAPRAALPQVEAALLSAGWEWVKDDPYDDAYYRRWMHELPPLIHRERDRMIDVHHTILPLTARPKPDAEAMITDSVVIGQNRRVLRIDDMICHAAAHLFADGDMGGGLRNLWDIHCLILDDGDRNIDRDFWPSLRTRAARHGLTRAVERAIRLTHAIYGTPVPQKFQTSVLGDVAFRARLLARDGWGRDRRWIVRQGFYLRSHLLRMPPLMLGRHLLTKWRKGYRPGG